jgi:hypothetical protein
MMGKRSNYKHAPKDFYPTPAKAARPLIPHLCASGVKSFAEPCCGDGALIRHLESHGLRCVHFSDIGTGQDALDLTPADINGAPIITNPPFSKESQPLLRRLIVHFQHISPAVWLLLPADFASNQWFVSFQPQCSDIVPIVRVRWIEGSKKHGMENFAWYRFDARHSAGPVFHANGVAPTRASRVSVCAHAQCRKAYTSRRTTSQFCSPTCRQRAHRSKASVSVTLA